MEKKNSKVISMRVDDERILQWISKQTNVTVSITTVLDEYIEKNGIVNLTESTDEGIPTSREMLNVVFESIGKIQEMTTSIFGAHIQEIYQRVEAVMEISESMLAVTSKGNECLVRNRERWCIFNLKNNGLIHSSKRGFYELTEIGKSLYESGIDVNDFGKIAEANHINNQIEKKNS